MEAVNCFSNFNEYTINTFKSNYIKEYLKKIDHHFYLEEMIPIIWDAEISFVDKQIFIGEVLNYLQKNDCSNYKYKDKEKLINNLLKIREDSLYVLECLEGKHNSIVGFYDSYGQFRCFKNLQCAIFYMRDLKILKGLVIVNGINSQETFYVSLLDDYSLSNFRICYDKDNDICELYDKYVDIPNDLDIGDVIKIVDGDDTEFVAVSNTKIPEKFYNSAEYSIDSCITVIPKRVLDSSRSFKEQINEIYENKKEGNMDIISKEHEHIHLSLVEKI